MMPASGVDVRERAEAVPLRFKHPIAIVERLAADLRAARREPHRYQLTVPCYPSATMLNWRRRARILPILGVLCLLIVANGQQTHASQQSQARPVNNILIGAEYLQGIRSLMTVVNLSNDAEKFLSRYDALTAIQNRLRGAGIATPAESNYRLILDVMTSVQKGGVHYNVSLWLSRPGTLVPPSKQLSFTRLIVLERGTMGSVGTNDARDTVTDAVYTLVDRFLALHQIVNAKYTGPLINDPQKLTPGIQVLGGIPALTTEVKIDSDLAGLANENQLASLVNNKLRKAGIFVGPAPTTLRLQINGFPTAEAGSYVYLVELKLFRRMHFISERNNKDLEIGQGWAWRNYRFGSVPTAEGTSQIQMEVQGLANNFLTDFRKANPK